MTSVQNNSTPLLMFRNLPTDKTTHGRIQHQMYLNQYHTNHSSFQTHSTKQAMTYAYTPFSATDYKLTLELSCKMNTSLRKTNNLTHNTCPTRNRSPQVSKLSLLSLLSSYQHLCASMTNLQSMSTQKADSGDTLVLKMTV